MFILPVVILYCTMSYRFSIFPNLRLETRDERRDTLLPDNVYLYCSLRTVNCSTVLSTVYRVFVYQFLVLAFLTSDTTRSSQPGQRSPDEGQRMSCNIYPIHIRPQYAYFKFSFCSRSTILHIQVPGSQLQHATSASSQNNEKLASSKFAVAFFLGR